MNLSIVTPIHHDSYLAEKFVQAVKEIENSLLSPKAKQKLGLNAQVPEGYDEYYVPKEQRKFKQEVE